MTFSILFSDLTVSLDNNFNLYPVLILITTHDTEQNMSQIKNMSHQANQIYHCKSEEIF